jgi:uncharacterized protein YbcV (DUF1398 family)
MFTIEQIKEAHSKVKTGADFPAYIRELKVLGVTGYTAYVTDGHTVYEGAHEYRVQSAAKYDIKKVADTCNAEQFMASLKAHQQGQSDYMTFCTQCAQWGIDQWNVSLEEMDCTYYDKVGNEVLVEVIPG